LAGFVSLRNRRLRYEIPNHIVSHRGEAASTDGGNSEQREDRRSQPASLRPVPIDDTVLNSIVAPVSRHYPIMN